MINFSFGLQSGYTEHPCIYKVFPGLTIEKLKNGIFNGTDIRKLIKDQNLITSMNELESKTWISFVAVAKNFLGNER